MQVKRQYTLTARHPGVSNHKSGESQPSRVRAVNDSSPSLQEIRLQLPTPIVGHFVPDIASKEHT